MRSASRVSMKIKEGAAHVRYPSAPSCERRGCKAARRGSLQWRAARIASAHPPHGSEGVEGE